MIEQIFPELANSIIDNIILILAGLWLLVKGSGLFVQAASSIARHFGVSEFVIGLTLIAIGTSLPELVSAIIASLNEQGSLVLGNIVGANIANLTLIVGGAAALRSMPIARAMLKRDGYMALFATILLGLFAINGSISIWEGAIFILFFGAYTMFLIRTSQTYEEAYHIKEFAQYFFKFRFLTDTLRSLTRILRSKGEGNVSVQAKSTELNWRNIIVLIFSILLIVLGGNTLVGEAIFFSEYFELPVTLVGVLLALGTTAPEMSVSIIAAKKGMAGIVIGNAIGSVLCNTFLILGVASTISPIAVSQLALTYAIPSLLFATLILLLFKKTGNLINRAEGTILLILYFAFILGYGILT